MNYKKSSTKKLPSEFMKMIWKLQTETLELTKIFPGLDRLTLLLTILFTWKQLDADFCPCCWRSRLWTPEDMICPDVPESKTVPKISWNKTRRLLVQNSYIIINWISLRHFVLMCGSYNCLFKLDNFQNLKWFQILHFISIQKSVKLKNDWSLSNIKTGKITGK